MEERPVADRLCGRRAAPHRGRGCHGRAPRRGRQHQRRARAGAVRRRHRGVRRPRSGRGQRGHRRGLVRVLLHPAVLLTADRQLERRRDVRHPAGHRPRGRPGRGRGAAQPAPGAPRAATSSRACGEVAERVAAGASDRELIDLVGGGGDATCSRSSGAASRSEPTGPRAAGARAVGPDRDPLPAASVPDGELALPTARRAAPRGRRRAPDRVARARSRPGRRRDGRGAPGGGRARRPARRRALSHGRLVKSRQAGTR